MGLVSKTGTWFTYGDTRLGQGRENAKVYLETNPEVMQELEAKIRDASTDEAEPNGAKPAKSEADSEE